MLYSLKRAAEDLKADVEKYQIEVRPEDNMIIWNGEGVHLRPYTPKTTCLREIRRIIKKAKQKEFEETQSSIFDNQSSLLEQE